MKEPTIKLLPIGTPVFYLQRGWGKISDHNSFGIYNLETTFTLSVDDNKECYVSFTPDGKLLADDTHPLLSLTEYSLESGGLTPISDYWTNSDYWTKPKIGDWGYFFDHDQQYSVLFSQLKKIDSDNKFHSDHCKWDNFSHDMPYHILEQMNK